MDNVSFHKSKEIKELIKQSSNTPLFIPPYSPELNPIVSRKPSRFAPKKKCFLILKEK